MEPEVLTMGHGAVLLSCEHASNVLPEGVEWGEDAHLANTHWAVDLGIASFTRSLAKRFESAAVLATFSRLWIDANRPLYSSTLFRETADGRPIAMNTNLHDLERKARVEQCWEPYHAALDRVCARAGAQMLLSMHSFTPNYEGQIREVEIGVLFDDYEALAAEVQQRLEGNGYVVRANEPWSGKGGLMYSCDNAAKAHGLLALELEIRQDLLADPVHVERMLDLVEAAVTQGLNAVSASRERLTEPGAR